MKPTKLSNLLVLGLALTITAVGCKHKTPPVTKLPNSGTTRDHPGSSGALNPQPPIANTGEGVNANNTGITATDADKFKDYIPHPDILQAQTIHFDFDKSAIKSEDQPKLDEAAKYMKDNPTHALRIEGNCDERGTEEYNRSLGERRAMAARENLARLGVDPGRVVTVSYGEDHPVDTGHSEASWSKNRRDDFVVLTPP